MVRVWNGCGEEYFRANIVLEDVFRKGHLGNVTGSVYSKRVAELGKMELPARVKGVSAKISEKFIMV